MSRIPHLGTVAAGLTAAAVLTATLGVPSAGAETANAPTRDGDQATNTVPAGWRLHDTYGGRLGQLQCIGFGDEGITNHQWLRYRCKAIGGWPPFWELWVWESPAASQP